MRIDNGGTRALQLCVALGDCVPVAAGLAGVWLGPRLAGDAAASVLLDSHLRCLSGLLLAIGLAFWTIIPDIQRLSERFRLLTALVVVSRLVSRFAVGTPDPPCCSADHGDRHHPSAGAVAMATVARPIGSAAY